MVTISLPGWVWLVMLLALVALAVGAVYGVMALTRAMVRPEPEFSGTVPVNDLSTDIPPDWDTEHPSANRDQLLSLADQERGTTEGIRHD